MLAREFRVNKDADLKKVISQGTRRKTKHFTVHVLATGSETPRFGFVVSNKVGRAPVRNLVKRHLREAAAEQIKGGLTGVDVVVRAFPHAAQTSWDDVVAELALGLTQQPR